MSAPYQASEWRRCRCWRLGHDQSDGGDPSEVWELVTGLCDYEKDLANILDFLKQSETKGGIGDLSKMFLGFIYMVLLCLDISRDVALHRSLFLVLAKVAQCATASDKVGPWIFHQVWLWCTHFATNAFTSSQDIEFEINCYNKLWKTGAEKMHHKRRRNKRHQSEIYNIYNWHKS